MKKIRLVGHKNTKIIQSIKTIKTNRKIRKNNRQKQAHRNTHKRTNSQWSAYTQDYIDVRETSTVYISIQ